MDRLLHNATCSISLSYIHHMSDFLYILRCSTYVVMGCQKIPRKVPFSQQQNVYSQQQLTYWDVIRTGIDSRLPCVSLVSLLAAVALEARYCSHTVRVKNVEQFLSIFGSNLPPSLYLVNYQRLTNHRGPEMEGASINYSKGLKTLFDLMYKR